MCVLKHKGGTECLKLGLFQKISDIGSLCADQGGTREGRQALKSDRPESEEYFHYVLRP